MKKLIIAIALLTGMTMGQDLAQQALTANDNLFAQFRRSQEVNIVVPLLQRICCSSSLRYSQF